MQIQTKAPTAKELNHFIDKDPRQGWIDIILNYGEEFAFQKQLVTANPERVYELLHNRKHTKKRSKAYTFMSKLIPGAPGILFQDGDIWQKRIKQVMPVFTKINLQSYHKHLYKTATHHAKNWHSKGHSEDVYFDVTNLGLEILLELGYGLDPTNPIVKSYGKSLRNYKLDTMYQSHRIDKLGLYFNSIGDVFSFIQELFRLKSRMRKQQKLLAQIIENKKFETGTLNWINIFHSVKMPLKEMTNELNHIYGAFNAIDYVLTCALYTLNAFPENCKAALYELKNTSFEDFQNSKKPALDFPEIYAFMRETFRFFPVAIAVMRQTGETFEATNRVWPVGSEVMIFLQAMHFNPKYWDNPNEFNPQRFKTPLKEPKAYIPFLAGPRRCIGQHLAERHFLYSLLAIVHVGLPKIDISKFEIQPYLIPRLVNKLEADFR